MTDLDSGGSWQMKRLQKEPASINSPEGSNVVAFGAALDQERAQRNEEGGFQIEAPGKA